MRDKRAHEERTPLLLTLISLSFLHVTLSTHPLLKKERERESTDSTESQTVFSSQFIVADLPDSIPRPPSPNPREEEKQI